MGCIPLGRNVSCIKAIVTLGAQVLVAQYFNPLHNTPVLGVFLGISWLITVQVAYLLLVPPHE